MEFRKSVNKDINSIMNIIRQAQDYFKAQGIDQWQNNYPNLQDINNDINNENGYVLIMDNMIVGTVALTFDGDKNYETVYEGNWISNSKYATIHRLAVDSNNKGHGLASVIFKNIENICLNIDIHSIRVDTHEENLQMQKLLNKEGFQYCGVIYLEDGGKRIAFEKIL